MTSTQWSRVDEMKLYPRFLTKVELLLHEAQERGAYFYVISGFRTYAEQSALYFQGRTTPGPKVTNAQFGQSAHNFGIAVDLCRDGNIERAGLQPDYRPEEYEVLRELAPKHGLLWGGSWQRPDRPHLQLPGYVTSFQLEPLRYSYELGGLLNVFMYLDAA